MPAHCVLLVSQYILSPYIFSGDGILFIEWNPSCAVPNIRIVSSVQSGFSHFTSKSPSTFITYISCLRECCFGNLMDDTTVKASEVVENDEIVVMKLCIRS